MCIVQSMLVKNPSESQGTSFLIIEKTWCPSAADQSSPSGLSARTRRSCQSSPGMEGRRHVPLCRRSQCFRLRDWLRSEGLCVELDKARNMARLYEERQLSSCHRRVKTSLIGFRLNYGFMQAWNIIICIWKYIAVLAFYAHRLSVDVCANATIWHFGEVLYIFIRLVHWRMIPSGFEICPMSHLDAIHAALTADLRNMFVSSTYNTRHFKIFESFSKPSNV